MWWHELRLFINYEISLNYSISWFFKPHIDFCSCCISKIISIHKLCYFLREKLTKLKCKISSLRFQNLHWFLLILKNLKRMKMNYEIGTTLYSMNYWTTWEKKRTVGQWEKETVGQWESSQELAIDQTKFH